MTETKKKVVIKVLLNDQKSRTKAIKTAVGVHGVIGATLMQEKDQIEIIGEGIDVVCLTYLLRKSNKYADVVSVSDVVEKKKEIKEENKEKEKIQVMWQYGTCVPHYQVCCIPDTCYCQDPSCNIM